MLRLLLLQFFLLTSFLTFAKTIPVKNIGELNEANKKAVPGDIVVLQDGEWNDVTIQLTCNGTAENPIIFKAETPGKLIIKGHSMLRIGGDYLVVDGFYFTDGYAGNDAVITFRASKDQLANHSRVTGTVINGFNNPKRLDENYWVSFYGKHNRLDHCSFFDKKNMGVLLAVILDDERSRENFHLIDHNYFGFRLPLASNSGEQIRVGVSQHCEFNSNTQIVDNFFEHCDGETEIISIKSCSNLVRNNLFKECQGAVVLRHGHYNIVENNIFLGNNKEGTGGVRVINKGQWVVNNFFYRCCGEGFRSPLSVMNGVPNSPAFRYVTVSDAVIANNSFYECTPLSFCEGSDTERSEAPKNVFFLNNLLFNSHDTVAYHVYDAISGIHFAGNITGNSYRQLMNPGFKQAVLASRPIGGIAFPYASAQSTNLISDSIQAISKTKTSHPLSTTAGFSNAALYEEIKKNAATGCGAGWFDKAVLSVARPAVVVRCKTAAEVEKALSENRNALLTIELSGKKYRFSRSLQIESDLLLTSGRGKKIKFYSSGAPFLFEVKAGHRFEMHNLHLDLGALHNAAFISTDTSGSSDHSNFISQNCSISNLEGSFFQATKSSVADSIIISNNSFDKGGKLLFNFAEEDGKRGYYNVEKLVIADNRINGRKGQLLSMLRSGNDESTMGPYLIFQNNKVSNCESTDALIVLYGTQRSEILNNVFTNANPQHILIRYEDIVRADHLLQHNQLIRSGTVVEDQFVRSSDN